MRLGVPLDIDDVTAALAARVHQLALLQGARYSSRVDEAGWSRKPATFQVPASDDPSQVRLPAGALLVLPWADNDPDVLLAWLAQLAGHRDGVPAHVVVLSQAGHFPVRVIAEARHRLGLELAIADVDTFGWQGSPRLLPALERVADPALAAELDAINPFEHVQGRVADPRDPRVFAERLRLAAPRLMVVPTLLALNIAVFVAMQLLDGFPLFGRFSTELVLSFGANTVALTHERGELWRLLACTFVHADVLHIAMNMWALKVLGDSAERLFGAPAFLGIYLVSGVGGSLASLVFTLSERPEVPSVGASGAIFGLMGALLGFALARRASVPRPLYRALTRSAIFFIVINGAIGLSVEFIDNGAHMGGLVYGILAGALLPRDLPPAKAPSLTARLTAAAVLAVALGAGMAAAGLLG